MKHILVVSQYYYPEQFRINDICEEWVKRGNRVTVVTGMPNYPEGRFYKGYGWFKKTRETVNGVDIIRLPIVSRGTSKIRLMMNYASFVITGWFWKTFTKVKADSVFIFEVSPMTQAEVGVWFAKRRNIPCTIYVQDLWPENLEAVAHISNGTILGAIDRMVDKIYRGCSNILTTSPSFKKRLELRESVKNPDGSSKVIYWPQYAEDFYHPVERGERPPDIPDDSNFKIVFTGNVGYAQGLDILPKTAAELKKRGITVDFVIIGDGRYMEEFKAEIESLGVVGYFSLLGRKMPTDIPKYLSWCDAGFISFADNELFNMTIPAKLQSYMACGMPILAVAGGETKRIVEEAGCGVAGNYDDAVGTVEKMLGLTSLEINKMRTNSLLYYRKHFSKHELMDYVETLVGNK